MVIFSFSNKKLEEGCRVDQEEITYQGFQDVFCFKDSCHLITGCLLRKAAIFSNPSRWIKEGRLHRKFYLIWVNYNFEEFVF
jgi:hypothetical protein